MSARPIPFDDESIPRFRQYLQEQDEEFMKEEDFLNRFNYRHIKHRYFRYHYRYATAEYKSLKRKLDAEGATMTPREKGFHVRKMMYNYKRMRYFGPKYAKLKQKIQDPNYTQFYKREEKIKKLALSYPDYPSELQQLMASLHSSFLHD
jgi:hypothetical protein